MKNIKLTVQEALDDLFSEGLTPFALTAHKVDTEGIGEYVVAFHDSRIHSMRFTWKQGSLFKETVRAAVLDRVNRMNGPSTSSVLRSVHATL